MAGIYIKPRPIAVVSAYGYGDLLAFDRPDVDSVARDQAYSFVGKEVLSETTFGSDLHLKRTEFYLYCRKTGVWQEKVLRFSPDAEPEKVTRFCPIRNVTADYPPTMLLHGGQDTDVPYQQSVAMAEALKAQHVPTELLVLPEQGHMFWFAKKNGKWGLNDSQKVKDAFKSVLAFLTQHVN